MIRRRTLLGFAALSAIAPVTVQSHTPYQQWTVYRKKHLLIGCHREDLHTWALAKKTVAHLESVLPDARSRVARAKTPGRLASLLGTSQLPTAILEPETALKIAHGREEFSPYGSIPLRLIAQMDGYLYVCLSELPDRHTWQIAHAMQSLPMVNIPQVLNSDILPLHAGVVALQSGKQVPEFVQSDDDQQ